MDLDRIRKMNDEELTKLLRQLSARGSKNCIKCNKPIRFIIKIENQDTFQTKKLCGLCEECYQELLNEFNLCDLEWDL